MKIEWDESKRLGNLRKHGIDFADVEIIFSGETVTIEDRRFNYLERRYITLGWCRENVVVVAHTETETVVRVISIRKANHHEQEIYFQRTSFPQEPD